MVSEEEGEECQTRIGMSMTSQFYNACDRTWAHAPKTTRILGGVDDGELFNVQGPTHTPITVDLISASSFDEEMGELEES